MTSSCVTYLFLMNSLYNIFVAATSRAVGLPQKLTKETPTLVVTALFRYQLVPIQRKTLSDLQNIEEVIFKPVDFFYFVLVQKLPIVAYDSIYLLNTIFLSKSPTERSVLDCDSIWPCCITRSLGYEATASNYLHREIHATPTSQT